ncbi:hypothetical protein KL86DYS2_20083 [uncultured Dysgonomonas sp.]|uniref:Uncharacterized protein n=1 Tax=uncultured Dysgonomonas sp. TaxID=206096 RepID=A0A212KFG2_9BACT|nr:hypothetical protein KL86DYS1_11413 [uncultured Dysgonomonas sp.]SBW10443.1 hypothetical protein KL86DYS2_20083 [uncultured Dysgonomonas sp.]
MRINQKVFIYKNKNKEQKYDEQKTIDIPAYIKCFGCAYIGAEEKYCSGER